MVLPGVHCSSAFGFAHVLPLHHLPATWQVSSAPESDERHEHAPPRHATWPGSQRLPPQVTAAISQAALPVASRTPRTPVQPVGVLPIARGAGRQPGALPSVPAILQPVGSSAGQGRGETLIIEAPLTQNVADRNIAAAATGGLGMN